MQEAIKWVHDFQLQVNEVVGGTFFQFRAEVWNPLETEKLPTIDEDIPAKEWEFCVEKVTVINKNSFPYLDMQLSRKGEELNFQYTAKEPDDKVC